MAECERVLHVLHSMNCGGAENLIMNIYRNIDRSKIQFDFLVNCFDEMFFEKEIKQFGGRIYRMKFLTQLTPPIYKHKLYRFFAEHREYKIVHSHLETTTGIILSCAKRACIPVRIAHSHNTRHTRSGGIFELENAYKNYCKSKIISNATKLFACSEDAAKWLFNEKASESIIIENGIEADKFRYNEEIRKEVRTDLNISDEVTALGHIGRFYDQKNHMFLIDVFCAYEKLNPNTVLCLVGEGVLFGQIKEKVESKGLTNKVKFFGLRDDVNRVLQGLDIFLLPSKFEGLPLTLIEAQAAGLNCFISDIISREADIGCGLITFLPIDSAVLWAEKIKTAPFKRKQTNESVKAAGYDIKVTAKWLEEYYCDMCFKT